MHLVAFIIRIDHNARSLERRSAVSNKNRFKSSGKTWFSHTVLLFV